MNPARRILAGGLLLAMTSLTWAVPRWDFSTEWVWSDDITLGQANANWRWEQPETGWTGDVSFAANQFDMDFEPVPFDFRGESARLDETSLALQGVVRWRTREDWEWIGSAGVYDGFTNYRSIWLSEYYRQQFESVQLPGEIEYVTPEPRGAGAGAGFRWEYQRASGYLEVLTTFRRDEVAPGYEIDFEGLTRGREILNAVGFSISSENILTPRIRSRVDLRGSQVSQRDWRWGGEVSVNIAVAGEGVLRLVGGGAIENPQFEAWYGGATFDWSLSDNWAVFTEGRIYDDTGEIENSFLFTNAAPGLHSYQGGLGVRWQRGQTAWRLKVARNVGDYAQGDPRLDFFQNLYADRHWNVFQLSYSKTF